MSRIKKLSVVSFGSNNSYVVKKKNRFVVANLFDNYFVGNSSFLNLNTQVDPFNFLVNRNTLLLENNNKKIYKKINNKFFSNFLFFIKKINFKGKGFKLKKTKDKKFKFFFGHSHSIYFFNFNLTSKKLTKYKHIFISTKFKKLKKILLP